METRTYTERSNARRAARAAGVDPTLVFETEDGFTFPAPAVADTNEILAEQTEASRCAMPSPKNGNAARPVDSAPKTDDDPIPAFCKITPEERKAAWERNPPKAAPIKTQETATMAKMKTGKSVKKDKRSGGDKNATLMSMLKKGASVDDLCKATDWLPHTLRARISRLNKPKSKGGEGLKIERSREDGVTSYRIAS